MGEGGGHILREMPAKSAAGREKILQPAVKLLVGS